MQICKSFAVCWYYTSMAIDFLFSVSSNSNTLQSYDGGAWVFASSMKLECFEEWEIDIGLASQPPPTPKPTPPPKVRLFSISCCEFISHSV